MMKTLQILLATLSVLLVLLTPVVASADANDKLFGACAVNAATEGSPVCKNKKAPANNPITNTINKAATIIASLTGVAAVIMLIIGGFNYITAGGAAPGQRAGDPNKVATAKRQITYSLVGLVVVALAWVFTRFITSVVIQ